MGVNFYDTVDILPVTQQQVDLRTQLFIDCVESGQLRVFLAPVRVVYKADEKSWRFPREIPELRVSEASVNHNAPLGPTSLIVRSNTLYQLEYEWSHNGGAVPDGFSCPLVYTETLERHLTKQPHVLEEKVIQIHRGPSIDPDMMPTHIVAPRVLTSTLSIGGDHLLVGGLGSGKTQTSLIVGLHESLKTRKKVFYFDCRRIRDTWDVRMNDILAELSRLFQQAVETEGCTVILDDLDSLIPRVDEDNQESSDSTLSTRNPTEADQARVIEDLIARLIGPTLRRRFSVVATCLDKNSISRLRWHPQPFEFVMGLPVLCEEELGRIASVLCCSVIERNSLDPMDLASFVERRVDGFSPRDLVQCLTQLNSRLDRAIHADVFEELTLSLRDHSLSSARGSDALENLNLAKSLDQIGGLFEAKATLQKMIINPLKYRLVYEAAGVPRPNGALLYGPPGCGKSVLVPAFASHHNLRVISCRGPQVLDRYIGSSESRIRELFRQAETVAPSILFFDEFDALAPRRGSDQSGVTDRIVNQLLTYLDGVESMSSRGNVFVIAASSRPDKIDPALLRPGRLEKHIHIGYPSSSEEWSDILLKVLHRYSASEETLAAVRSGALLQRMEAINPTVWKLSPADMLGAVKAALLKLRDQTGLAMASITLDLEAIESELCRSAASLPEEEQRKLEAVYSPLRSPRDSRARAEANPNDWGLNSPGSLRTALR